MTAGNAFGLTTAGIDAAVVQRFGVSLMERIQHHILDEYMGEQPVGTAFVVATNDATLPFIAHAPTMRVPGSIAVAIWKTQTHGAGAPWNPEYVDGFAGG